MKNNVILHVYFNETRTYYIRTNLKKKTEGASHLKSLYRVTKESTISLRRLGCFARTYKNLHFRKFRSLCN